MKYFAFLFIVCIVSCNDSLREKQKDLSMALGNVSKMEILFLNSTDTLKYVEKKKNIIENFKDLFYKKSNDLNFDTTGKINFMEDDKIIFIAYFSMKDKADDGLMAYTINKINYTVKLTSKTGMYLNETFNSLKK